ncbi:acyltransferase family protein [Modestobacter sp. VKM Ac-2986]|uniref:acyltransferase family protein n=1 Tax=Modestobacter sp. VKM Ac-2986 TaxID=3004140 RepID=UPI0022ABC196|nr:acyltransferase family protein [Modestobacter sp. VKM Ac-2986]MCZ2829742.1 acyltransferase family protein [Modestobacter sp. VKM Ac-2986]
MRGRSSVVVEGSGATAQAPVDDRTERIPTVGLPSSPPRVAPPAPPGPAASAVRVEIQALRALAVSLVVLYHVVPLRMPGGYVGVDVFFVVSGFLITGHLVREVERNGRVRLGHFWARRARRLLPAALLVLLSTAVAVFLWVPQTYWQQFLREIGASALYVENWVLAGDAVDYLAHTNAASPAQHYWSLSTEEQFYLLWPLLIVAATWLAVRLGARRRTVLVALLGTLTVASFAYSLWTTRTSPPAAYFTTPARAWQFGLGGLLALVAATPLQDRHRLRAVVSWAGFGAIALSALTFTAQTPFPGTAALLPVLGTVAVIWAGAPAGDWSPTAVAHFGPVRFLGDVSYSAYLWHWPLVVVLPFALGHDLGTRSKIAVLLATVVLGWATKVAVEDPVRTGTPLARRGLGTTFAATAVATAVVLGVAGGGWFYVQSRVEGARAAAAAFATGGDPCFGAGATDAQRQCGDPYAYTDTVDTTFAKSDLSAGMPCLQGGTATELKTCRYGSADATETVALIGDSHTASMYEALQQVADDRGWAVVTYVKAGCPVLGTDRLLGANMPLEEPPACKVWADELLAQLAADPGITRVFTSYRSDIYKWVDGSGGLQDAIPVETLQAPLRTLADAGKQVHVLRAVPTTNGVHLGPESRNLEVSAPDCIAAAGRVDDPCAGPRDLRLTPDQLADAAVAMDDDRISVIDLTDRFCDEQLCHEVVGGTVVYFDGSHLTATFSRSLGQFIAAQL